MFTELRNNGARLAVDDAAAGYAGLKRVAEIRPDFVKLDRGLITGSRYNLEQISVIEAIVSLSHRLGSLVIGEGVESFDDLATLAELDVDYAQGHGDRHAAHGPAAGLARRGQGLPHTSRPAAAGRVAAGARAAQRGPAPVELGARRISRAERPRRCVECRRGRSRRRPDRVVAARRTGQTRRPSLFELRASVPDVDDAVYRLSDYPATALVAGDRVARRGAPRRPDERYCRAAAAGRVRVRQRTDGAVVSRKGARSGSSSSGSTSCGAGRSATSPWPGCSPIMSRRRSPGSNPSCAHTSSSPQLRGLISGRVAS